MFVILLKRLKFFHSATSLALFHHWTFQLFSAITVPEFKHWHVHAQQYYFHPYCVTSEAFCTRKSATNHVFIKYTLKLDCTKSLEVVHKAHHPPAQDTRSSCNVCLLQKTTSTGPALHCTEPWQHMSTLPNPSLHQPRQSGNRASPATSPTVPMKCSQPPELTLGYSKQQQQARSMHGKAKLPLT